MLKEINDFIADSHSYLNSIPEQLIEDYLDDSDIPEFISWKLEEKEILEINSKATKYLYEARELAYRYSSAEDLIYKLFSLERLYSFLVDEKTKLLKESPNDIIFKFSKQTNKRKSTVIISLYKLLREHKRINNTESQRRAFVSLSLKDKPTEKIIWHGYMSDLRGFFSALINNGLIAFNMTEVNQFAAENFLYRNQKKSIVSIDSEIFRGYQTKTAFYKADDFWSNELKGIKQLRRLDLKA